MAVTTSPNASPVSMEESVGTVTPREPEEQQSTTETIGRMDDNQNDQRKKGKITEFVESSFASFDRRFFHIGFSKKSSSKNKNNNKSDEENEHSTAEPPKRQKTKEEQDEDDAYATFTYLAILTALYLPFLLFLWIRRNVFGTASLVRSLFLGHMLRFGVAFMLLPPSTTRTIVPERVWNYGVRTANRLERLWSNKRVQALIPSWVHFVLTLILGVQTDPLHPGGVGMVVGNSNNAGNGVWPPPALMGLGVFTLLAFVVHPDGLTWIMLSQMRDGIQSSISQTAQYVRLVLNGEIKLTPSEISGTLASIIIFVTIVNHILSNRNAEKNARAPHAKEKANKHKGKRGKKGRGRHHHHHSASQKGRIKGGGSSNGSSNGGHYRSSKDMYEASSTTKSPLPSPPPSSRSPSPSISIQERTRCMSDMEETAVSSAGTAETLNMNTAPSTHVEKKKVSSPLSSPSNVNANVNVKKMHTHNEVSSTSTLTQNSRTTREVRIMECTEDDKSCSSSIATAQTHATFPQPSSTSLDMPDKDSVGGSSSRRRNRNRKNRRSGGNGHGQGQNINNKNQPNTTFVPVSSPSSVPTTPMSRDTKARTERKTRAYSPSSPPHTATTASAKKAQTNSLDRKGQRSKMKQNSHQQGRKTSHREMVASDIHVSSFRKGAASNTNTTTVAMAKQNRERSFTAPEPTINNSMAKVDNNNNRIHNNRVNHRSEAVTAESTRVMEKPVQMEAFVPVDTLESRMISESIRAQREQEQQQLQLQLQMLSSQNYASPVSNPRPIESLGSSNSTAYVQPQQPYSYSNEVSNEGFLKPGKLELASFLSRVGLVGTLSGNLLADLADVSSLALLTDADYDRYGIGYTKRSEIRHLLESRGMRQQALLERSQKTIGWSNTSHNNSVSLRPPPGLVSPAPDSAVGGQRIASQTASCGPGDAHQSLAFLSSSTVSTASNSNFSFSAGSSLNSLSMPLGVPQCNEGQLPGAISSVDSTARNNIALPPIGHAISQKQEKVHVNGGLGSMYSPKVHNDEEIEADLQELGGQMAGSILDF